MCSHSGMAHNGRPPPLSQSVHSATQILINSHQMHEAKPRTETYFSPLPLSLTLRGSLNSPCEATTGDMAMWFLASSFSTAAPEKFENKRTRVLYCMRSRGPVVAAVARWHRDTYP